MKGEVIKLITSFVIFLVALVTKNTQIAFVLFLISYLLLAFNVLKKAISNMLNGNMFDENFLMSIATIGAFAIGQYSEGVAVMLFYTLGEILQNKAVNNSRKSIKSLLKLKPTYANLVNGDKTTKLHPKDVNVGDIILIKPSEKIPLDGIIISGSSSLDTSALTGESLPVDVKENDEILSGMINTYGLLKVKVTKTFDNSAISKVVELIQNASNKKSKTENFITKFARFYTPIVVICALLIAFLPPILIKDAVFSDWLYKALTFLVVSCPCALVISVPLGFFSGIGKASKNGILIKGSNFLELLSQTSTVVFDKTGTITYGNFKVNKIFSNTLPQEELLKIVAYAESYSSHPIAKSIVSHFNQEIDFTKIKNYKEVPGLGIFAEIFNKNVKVGNEKFIEKPTPHTSYGTTVYIEIDGKYEGYIEISDEIKESSKNLISKLQKYDTIMLSGDNEKIAKKVAQDVGIKQTFAKLLPEDKYIKLQQIKQNSNFPVCFVGDGINDAPALAYADIGISMGNRGLDIAIESSDIVIMDDDLTKIYYAFQISKLTMKIVKQNIFLALSIKVLVLILGVFGLSTLWEAIIADVGVSLLAILNSTRISK